MNGIDPKLFARRPVLHAALATIMMFYLSGQAHAETLSFEGVLAKALRHSVELKIAETDIAISAHHRDEVLSLYYPSLNLRFYNEYVKMLEEQGMDVVAVGDYVSAAPRSTYQHSLVAGLTYRLYDFGARELKLESAEREGRISRLQADQTGLDVRREVLDAYARGLVLSRQLAASREIVERRKEIFRHSRRLREAGTLGQHQLEQAGLKLAEAVSRGDDLRTSMQKALGRLGYFTGETYPLEGTDFADLPDPAEEVVPGVPDVGLLPGIKALDEEISKKEAEHATAQREMLPRLSMQSSYRWFGRNEDGFYDSLRNLSERDATIAVFAEWEFFSGFRDLAKGRRLKEEIRRLQLQREKRLAEFREDAATLYETCRLHRKAGEEMEGRRSMIEQGRSTLGRLSEQQITDQVGTLAAEIELVEQDLDVWLKRIEGAVAAHKLGLYVLGVGR